MQTKMHARQETEKNALSLHEQQEDYNTDLISSKKHTE